MILQHIATHCNKLQHTAVECFYRVHHAAVKCLSAFIRVSSDCKCKEIGYWDCDFVLLVCCSVLQCAASVMQCHPGAWHTMTLFYNQQPNKCCCTMLQCVAVCCRCVQCHLIVMWWLVVE